MLNVRKWALAAASGWVVLVTASRGVTLQEDFTTDPATRGWQAFGDTSLFHWSAANGNLEVTWDSSKPNSYYSLPLGTVLAKDNDFSVAFDLRLSEFAAGVNPQKPYPFQLAVAFINLAEARDAGFARGTGTNSPDLAEFSFFPDPGGPWIYGPSITPVMVDSDGGDPYQDWAYGFGGFSLTTQDLYHVSLSYTAGSHTLHTEITRNGSETLGPIYDAILPAGFKDCRLDHIAVCSYSDALQIPDFPGSIYARGTLDNFLVTLPGPALSSITGGMVGAGWQVQFSSLTNFTYTLERTVDGQSWTNVNAAVPGTGANLVLQDTNAPPTSALYRVRADRP
jgi:hypothetical protein